MEEEPLPKAQAEGSERAAHGCVAVVDIPSLNTDRKHARADIVYEIVKVPQGSPWWLPLKIPGG